MTQTIMYITLPEKGERKQMKGAGHPRLQLGIKVENHNRLLLVLILSRAVRDFFSANWREADDSRWYFANEDGTYQQHLQLLGLPTQWLPEEIEPYAIKE